MSTNRSERDCEEQLTSKEKRAIYMARLRGSINSEYRHLERKNNARAMRKKRSENPLYRERERRQNRVHMAEIRRENSEYRQREHIKNHHRISLKPSLLCRISSKKSDRTETISNTDKMINPVYRTLENNLQSSHISFIPYESNSFNPFQQLSSTNQTSSEFELLQHVDEYCRLRDARSSLDSNSRSTASTSSH